MASSNQQKTVSDYIGRHFRHFNAATLIDAADAYKDHLRQGGKMMITLAGAMSTAELGLSLAELIRQDKVHAISCTGANLEEDIYNLVAHDHYERLPNYRDLAPADEQKLLDRQLNRVTDTCIPEEEAMRRIERKFMDRCRELETKDERAFPHQILYQLLRDGAWHSDYQIDPADSWMAAASEKDLPLFVPGWEDSTLGNMFAASCINGSIENPSTIRSGVEYMIELKRWYENECSRMGGGFFQIGGGIAGDFPICVVPMMEQDLYMAGVKKWEYFCQISDSTTSYGSYSGAVPNEKITWGKLAIDTPKFVIESDATIVAPLIFARVLAAESPETA